MLNYLLVFIGGGFGSIFRYGIAHSMSRYAFTFPYTTLVANIVSCIILGALLGWSMQGKTTDVHKFLLMTGFCGGFSTFSTFTGETFQLLQNGEHFLALMNVFGSIVVCLICFYLGVRLAQGWT